MRAHGELGDDQLAGDLPVGVTLGEELEDLLFACGEFWLWFGLNREMVETLQETASDTRMEWGAIQYGGAQGLDEVVRGDVLER